MPSPGSARARSITWVILGPQWPNPRAAGSTLWLGCRLRATSHRKESSEHTTHVRLKEDDVRARRNHGDDGLIIDASCLWGVLVRIDGPGLTLISLTPINTETAQAATSEVRSTNRTGHDRTRRRSPSTDCDRRTFTAPGVGSWGNSTIHWPRSSRTSVADDPAPLGTLGVGARHAASGVALKGACGTSVRRFPPGSSR